MRGTHSSFVPPLENVHIIPQNCYRIMTILTPFLNLYTVFGFIHRFWIYTPFLVLKIHKVVREEGRERAAYNQVS